MYTYKTLENTPMEMMHRSFVKAFSDYQVTIEMPMWKLQGMLTRRGFDAAASMGAFLQEGAFQGEGAFSREGELVGFIFNGFRNWNGIPTAYDNGTAVIPEYRKQGITTAMFDQTKELLVKKGAKQYLLEVLQVNAAAFELYKRLGFEVTRSLACFKLEKENAKLEANWETCQLDGIEAEDWPLLESFWDFQPSWQNSTDSVRAVPEHFAYAAVKAEGNIVGYGMIDKNTGDVPQLAVHRDYRKKGIGRSLMAALAEHTTASRLGILNVDYASQDTMDFLMACGFERYVDQYEMLLKL